jgi:hypothetical protein
MAGRASDIAGRNRRGLVRVLGLDTSSGRHLHSPSIGVGEISIHPAKSLINALAFHCMEDSLLLDGLDRRIVARLERNARSSFATIGAEVGLSAPAVKRRVDRLIESGVITGFHAALDPRALGQGVEVFVELYCSGRTSAVEIARIVSRHTEVQEAYTVTGISGSASHPT